MPHVTVKMYRGRSEADKQRLAEAIANAMTSATFRGEELFRYIDRVAEVSLEDVQRCLEEHLLPQRAVLSVIFPKGNEMNIGGNDHD